MEDVADFMTALLDRDKRQYYKDDNGDIWLPYIFEYRHDGRPYGITLWARNVDEAEEVKLSVRNTLKLTGEIIQEIK